MTTQSWSSRIRHDSDAMFREWGLEFSTKLAAVGLVQTADTGQIDWGTVNRPGTNTNAGYEIWTFDDAQQGTAPIYIRFDYGTGSQAAAPRLQVTVGTGSNGSGTLTGDALTSARQVGVSNTGATTDTAYQSYMCYVDGFFGFDWKSGSGNVGKWTLFICRSCDADGVADATGAAVLWCQAFSQNTINFGQCLRFASVATSYTAVALPRAVYVPWNQGNSALPGSDIQAYLGWAIQPRVVPLVSICGVFDSEISKGTTFNATLVGSTQRTYIGLETDTGFGTSTFLGTGDVVKLAMLWE